MICVISMVQFPASDSLTPRLTLRRSGTQQHSAYYTMFANRENGALCVVRGCSDKGLIPSALLYKEVVDDVYRNLVRASRFELTHVY